MRLDASEQFRGALITVAGLTFSVTMVMLQPTSSQFSPAGAAQLPRRSCRAADDRLVPSSIRRDRADAEPLVVRQRSFEEYLESLAEIGR